MDFVLSFLKDRSILFLLPKSQAKEDILFYLYITYTNKTSLAVYNLFDIDTIILYIDSVNHCSCIVTLTLK